MSDEAKKILTMRIIESSEPVPVDRSIDLSTSTLYMKDLSLKDFAPDWDEKIKDNIKVPTVPYRNYCFMNSVRQFFLLDAKK